MLESTLENKQNSGCDGAVLSQLFHTECWWRASLLPVLHSTNNSLQGAVSLFLRAPPIMEGPWDVCLSGCYQEVHRCHGKHMRCNRTAQHDWRAHDWFYTLSAAPPVISLSVLHWLGCLGAHKASRDLKNCCWIGQNRHLERKSAHTCLFLKFCPGFGYITLIWEYFKIKSKVFKITELGVRV